MINPTTVKTDSRAVAPEAAKRPSASSAPFHPPAQTGESFSTAQTEALRQALARTPEIRPEMVARGQTLAADPDYPSPAVIRQISGLIVNSQDASEPGA
jgi:hypothetical protein